jgi:hypothetical protein
MGDTVRSSSRFSYWVQSAFLLRIIAALIFVADHKNTILERKDKNLVDTEVGE